MKTDILDSIEDLIHQGNSHEASRRLQKLTINKIPRNRLVTAAELCRRVGLASQGLKILKPVVRSNNPHVQPTAAEMAVYGQLLASVGGSEEAIRLLEGSPALDTEPRAHLYLAFAYFAQWNYRDSLPHLRSYLESVDSSSYQYSIGQVNYAAALLATQNFNEAEPLLSNLIERFDQQNHRILSGNCRELYAQLLFRKKQFHKALPLLEQASQLLGNKYPDVLFVEKWKTLVQCESSGFSKESLSKVEKLKITARRYHHWETLRDIDLQLSLIKSDEHLFNRVYYGTPFRGYREAIGSMTSLGIQQRFIRPLSHREPTPNTVYNLDQMDRGPKAIFKPGSLYHKLFLRLAGDFYRPIRIPTLFSLIYPDEYYDVEFSTSKVKMLISRLRKVLAPLKIQVKEIEGKGYTLDSAEPIGLIYRIESQQVPETSHEFRKARLERRFSDQPFKSQQVADLFQVSTRTANRWLKEMLDNGVLTKSGAKKGTTYQLNSFKKAS